MKKGIKTTLSVVFNIILWAVILIAAGVTIVSLTTKEKGVANIGGYIPFSIQTDSMEDTIKTGDLIITKKYDGTTLLKKDDIISFFTFEGEAKIIKTHRVYEVKNEGGLVSYVTKGDNTIGIDAAEVAPGDIVSTYTGTRFAILGYILTFLKSKYGFLICIILPLFGIFVYQLYKFIALVIDEKKKQTIKEIEEAVRKQQEAMKQ